MKKTILTLCALFIAVFANAGEFLTPVMRPDEGPEHINLLNMLIGSSICVVIGIYLIGLDKRLKKELRNKN
jgi:hypothetical protein